MAEEKKQNKEIIEQAKSEISNFKDGEIKISSNVSYKMRNVIEKCRQNIHHQLEEPEEADGSEKIVVPMTSWLCEVIQRNSDLDTKDINLRTTKPEQFGIVALIRYALQSFLKRMEFGVFINELIQYSIQDGTRVVKIREKGKLEGVDLLNVVIDPTAEDIQTAGLTECKLIHIDKLKEFKSEWSNFKKITEYAKKAFKDKKTPMVPIFERWNVYPKNWEKGSKNDLVRGCVILSANFDNPDEPAELQNIFESPYDKKRYPYEELRLERLQGRWAGRGTAEKVIHIQQYVNEMTNLDLKNARQSLRGVFKHSGGARTRLTQKMISQLETGGIIDLEGNEDLVELAKSSKFGEFKNRESSILEWARRTSGATAISSSEELPAQQPATTTLIQQKNATTTFDLVRENTGLFLKKILEKYVLKSIIASLKNKDIIDLVRDKKELEELDRKVIDHYVNKEVLKFNEQNGFFPTAGEVDQIKKEMLNKVKNLGDTRFVKNKKELFENIDVYCDIYMTNEQFDKNVIVKGLNDLLTGYNQLSGGKIDTDKVIKEILDLLGLHGEEFYKSEEEQEREMRAIQMKMAGERKREESEGAPAGRESSYRGGRGASGIKPSTEESINTGAAVRPMAGAGVRV